MKKTVKMAKKVVGKQAKKPRVKPFQFEYVEEVEFGIGSFTFCSLFHFYWHEHKWSCPIPPTALWEDYGAIVARENPKLLKGGIGTYLPKGYFSKISQIEASELEGGVE